MKGRDITKTKGWATLAALGFKPVKFHGQMGYCEIGAALEHGSGAEVITIEPKEYRDIGKVWSISTGGTAANWMPQPPAPLSRYDTAGHTVYNGPAQYMPVDRPFGAYVSGRGIRAKVAELVAQLRTA